MSRVPRHAAALIAHTMRDARRDLDGRDACRRHLESRAVRASTNPIPTLAGPCRGGAATGWTTGYAVILCSLYGKCAFRSQSQDPT